MPRIERRQVAGACSLKRRRQIREAVLTFNFPKIVFELEKQSVSAVLGLELLEVVRQLGVLAIPIRNPQREAQRDRFVEPLRKWALKHGLNDLLSAVDEHEHQARLCESVFHLILDGLQACPTGKLSPNLAAWSVLLGTARDANQVSAAVATTKPSFVGTDTIYLSAESLRVTAFDREGIDPDSAAERYADNLSGYLKMLGHKHGWFREDGLVLPRLATVPHDVSGDRSAMYLAEVWNQFEGHWAKVRYFPSSEVCLVTPSEPDGIATLMFTHDPEFFLDVEIARSRLRRQAFEIAMHVIYSPKTRPLIGDPTKETVPLAPRGFLSVIEAISMMVLDICYELNIRNEKSPYLHLTVAQWLRGYALLQMCSETGLCIIPIAEGIGRLDKSAFAQLARSASIHPEACDGFLHHATFGPKSRDLWDTPLLLDEDGDLIVLTSLMRSCNLAEALVSRLNSLLQQVKSKGPKFEADVRSLYEQLGAKVEQIKYHAESGIYECDAAALWDDVLFLNECKVYILPQPAAEDLYFFKSKQQDAVDQIRRVARHLTQEPGILAKRFPQGSDASNTVLCVVNQAPFWTNIFGSDVNFYDRGALSKFSSGSIDVVIRSAESKVDSPAGEAVLDHLWSGDEPIPEDLLKQMAIMRASAKLGWRLHYRVSRTMGGSTSAENCLLLHPECHDRVHRLRLSVSKPRLLPRGVRRA